MEIELKDAAELHEKVSLLLDGVNNRLAVAAIHLILVEILDLQSENGVTTKMRESKTGNRISVKTEIKIDRYN